MAQPRGPGLLPRQDWTTPYARTRHAHRRDINVCRYAVDSSWPHNDIAAPWAFRVVPLPSFYTGRFGRGQPRRLLAAPDMRRRRAAAALRKAHAAVFATRSAAARALTLFMAYGAPALPDACYNMSVYAVWRCFSLPALSSFLFIVVLDPAVGCLPIFCYINQP